MEPRTGVNRTERDAQALASTQPDTAWSWRARALILLALLAGIAVAFADVLGADRGLFFRDHALTFRPRWWAVSKALGRGELPALTRASSDGVPLEHLLNGTFTPPTLLFLLFDFDLAYDLFVIAHYVILAIGAHTLAAALGARPREALVAAAMATLSGPIIALENLVVLLQGVAWAPWVYWALYRHLRQPSVGTVALLGLTAGFHLQGFEPILVVLDLLAVIALAAVVRPRLGPAMLGGGLVAAVGALALAAVELMPVLEVLGSSERGAGFSYAERSGWALEPLLFLELLVPSFWAPPELPFINVPKATNYAEDTPYFVTLYMGAGLALVAAGASWRGARGWLGGVLLVALVVAMGRHTPLHRLLADLPVLSWGRYAIKYLLVVAACGAALAVPALRAVEREPRRLLAAALIQATLLLVLLINASSPDLREYLKYFIKPPPSIPPFQGINRPAAVAFTAHAMQARLAFALVAPLLLTGVALLLKRGGPLLGRIAAPVLLLDLALAATFGIHGVDLAAQRLPEEAARILAGDEHRFFPETSGGKMAAISLEVGRTPFEAMLISNGQRALLAQQVARRYLDLGLNGQSHRVHERVFYAINTAPRPDAYRALARLGVHYLTSWAPELDAELVLRSPVAHEAAEHIYRLPDAAPYVRAFASWEVMPADSVAARGIVEHLMDPERAGVALVYAPPPEVPAPECETAPAITRLPAPSHERVAALVEGPCPSVVVVQEVAVLGWTVEIDGQPAPLLSAEAGYLAAWVPAGRHEVRFVYRPLSARWLPVSAAALVLLLGLGVIAGWRRWRRGSSGARRDLAL